MGLLYVLHRGLRKGFDPTFFSILKFRSKSWLVPDPGFWSGLCSVRTGFSNKPGFGSWFSESGSETLLVCTSTSHGVALFIWSCTEIIYSSDYYSGRNKFNCREKYIVFWPTTYFVMWIGLKNYIFNFDCFVYYETNCSLLKEILWENSWEFLLQKW